MDPQLQSRIGESLELRMVNREEGAQLEIKAQGFGGMIDNVYSLMFGYSIPLQKPIKISPWTSAT